MGGVDVATAAGAETEATGTTRVEEVDGGVVVEEAAGAVLCGSLGYQMGVAVCGMMLLKPWMLGSTVVTGVPSAARMEKRGL